MHDIGHLGKNYLSDPEQKKIHWKLGAKIAFKLFGYKGYLMVAGHDSNSWVTRSKLYKADKYAFYIAPYWWLYWNNIVEPKVKCGLKNRDAILQFQTWVKKNIESGEYKSSHDAFIERVNKCK